MTYNAVVSTAGAPGRGWRSVLVLFLAGIALVLLIPTGEPNTTTNDFAFYWTAARLTLDGLNPYSPRDTLNLQRRLSVSGKGQLVMLNPPWTLPLIAPLGLLPFSMGRFLWLLINLTSLFISVHWLWDLYEPGENRWIGWLVVVTFMPVAVVLAIGQIGPLILFGLVGYLRFEASRDDYVAGAFLFLAAIKPHLVFLVWLALLLYALNQRRWKPVVALIAAFAVASFLAVVLDHKVFQQYAGLLSGEVVSQETPTIAGLLRHISGFVPMQFLLIGVAGVWFGAYWTSRRSNWEWRYQLPSLLLVSMATTSYGWFFDQVVLLPSMFYVTGLLLRSRRDILVKAALAYFCINGVVLLLLLNHRTTFWYSWTALAWLALCTSVQHHVARRMFP